METMVRRMHAALLLPLCVFLLVCAVAWWRSAHADPCAATISTEAIICYETEARKITRQSGVTDALLFIERTLFKNSNWSVAHLVMHTIGQEAYRQTGSVSAALAFIPKNIELSDGAFISESKYDGFKHGVLQEFFFTHSGSSLAEALPEACGSIETSVAVADPRGDSFFEGEKCFHAVGHALMYTYENDVGYSAAQCRTLQNENHRRWCLFGVYMENSYLYLPFYAPEAPRPDVSGGSMAPLCERIAESMEKRTCVKFVGRAYLGAHASDSRGAFEDCRRFPEDADTCIANTVRMYLMPAFQGNVDRMAIQCRLLSGSERQVCINAFAYGFTIGAGGFDRATDRQDFCAVAERTLGMACGSVDEWDTYI